MKAGRKLTYKTPKEMEKVIDKYFESCKGEPLIIDGEPYIDKQGRPVMINAHPPTVTGLALALGFASRQALINYANKDEFNDTITRAKMRVEEYCEERLFDRDGTRGAEFSLTHNFRWDDKADSDDDTSGVVILAPVMAMPSMPDKSEDEDEQE